MATANKMSARLRFMTAIRAFVGPSEGRTIMVFYHIV